uniref:Uncharacterized protein n=1 Tax=Cacopsylla melanoneura TaxID=428564 RepID=A0A8D8Y093_9HEMI
MTKRQGGVTSSIISPEMPALMIHVSGSNKFNVKTFHFNHSRITATAVVTPVPCSATDHLVTLIPLLIVNAPTVLPLAPVLCTKTILLVLCTRTIRSQRITWKTL